MNQDLQAQARQMRACADKVEATANALAQVAEMRAQAANLSAQADAMEKQAHDALEATGCYHPASAKASASEATVDASAPAVSAPMLAWDGLKFASV